LVCLAYHRISAAPSALADPYTVPPVQFAAQMAWLARAGCRGVPLGRAGRGPREVALTFDDGDAEFITTAWPVLRAHGFSATVFVVAGHVGGQADWSGAEGMPLLDWPQLATLAAAGVEIGAHGLHHVPLDALPLEQAAPALRQAYDCLAARLPHWPVGLGPAGLAYPYGRWSAAAAEAARQAGFRWACTARGGRNGPATPPFKLRRTLMLGRDGPLAFQVKARTGYARLVEWRMDWRRVP
jgi:peptidoglycan/xylan/chitin deacetylase (PgdA/CDA1 family)